MEEERGHDAAVPFIEVLQPCPPRGGGQEEEVMLCLCGGACVRVCVFEVKSSSSLLTCNYGPHVVHLYGSVMSGGKEHHRRQTGE